jgi:hypothetical protein
MSAITSVSLAMRALHELGAEQLWHYTWYQLQLRSSILRLRTRPPRPEFARASDTHSLRELAPLPERQQLTNLLGPQGVGEVIQNADEILAGQVRLFGGEPVRLCLEPPTPLRHWTYYEGRGINQIIGDPKQIWEHGRFGWTLALARAYHLNQDERYAEAFWKYTELFLDLNPPYLGPHWASAQEVALRLVILVFVHPILAPSPHSTPKRMRRLGQAVIAHAGRIPPTLSYARAQNNNHLLSEAVGLYAAGLALPDHPQAKRWHKLGRRWFNRAIQTQIAADGAYVQQSTNYHRLMLQLATFADMVARHDGYSLPAETVKRLAASIQWLHRLVDPHTGRAPNLGANDGAYILPLTNCAFEDYRPALQTAGRAFLGRNLFPGGAWDEMCMWLTPQVAGGQKIADKPEEPTSPVIKQPYRLDNPAHSSWAYLRAVNISSRPSHADQLHVDLWWRGLNLAQDAGTYLYNDPPPWDNALTRTAIHNTLTINGLDQMNHAGRFLWLDWAQARLLNCELAEDGFWQQVTAEHDGYRRSALLHRRTLRTQRDGRWIVVDQILPAAAPQANLPGVTARLQWLLPDWPWEISEADQSCLLQLSSPHGSIRLQLEYPPSFQSPAASPISLARAGSLVYGSGVSSLTRGWVSPTYNSKVPALSLALEIHNIPPFTLTSNWELPE